MNCHPERSAILLLPGAPGPCFGTWESNEPIGFLQRSESLSAVPGIFFRRYFWIGHYTTGSRKKLALVPPKCFDLILLDRFREQPNDQTFVFARTYGGDRIVWRSSYQLCSGHARCKTCDDSKLVDFQGT